MSAALQQFRITADWEGGGFGYTKPFASEAEALAWGAARSRFHPDAVVTVTPREDIAPLSAAEFTDSLLGDQLHEQMHAERVRAVLP
jgi:alkylhydroperoxidase family enzyme